jgi:hypothetical protein
MTAKELADYIASIGKELQAAAQTTNEPILAYLLAKLVEEAERIVRCAAAHELRLERKKAA